jgi:hypothetical protein
MHRYLIINIGVLILWLTRLIAIVILLFYCVPSASSFWHYQGICSFILVLMRASQLPQKEPPSSAALVGAGKRSRQFPAMAGLRRNCLASAQQSLLPVV